MRDQLDRLGPAGGDARNEAAAAERALREQTARVTAVESALGVVPPAARDGLVEALRVLVGQLEAGVAAYERLVAAAAECVAAASRGGDSFALHRLEEAADALAGLASGLYELNTARHPAGF